MNNFFKAVVIPVLLLVSFQANAVSSEETKTVPADEVQVGLLKKVVNAGYSASSSAYDFVAPYANSAKNAATDNKVTNYLSETKLAQLLSENSAKLAALDKKQWAVLGVVTAAAVAVAGYVVYTRKAAKKAPEKSAE